MPLVGCRTLQKEYYITYFNKTPADLVAGRIDIIMKSKDSICEVYDRCKFDQEFFVREFHFGATANLLVRKKVFEKIGVFDSSLVSSGDLEFWALLVFFFFGPDMDLIISKRACNWVLSAKGETVFAVR